MAKQKPSTNAVRTPNDVTTSYIAETIAAAKNGNVEAAEEALSLFRGAVDARNIDGSSLVYRGLAEYVAERLWAYENGGVPIEDALGVSTKRGPGQPAGTRKVDQSSYAALMILLTRQLGSADKAKEKILEAESDLLGKPIVQKRTLDSIYADYAPSRKADHDLLVDMLSPMHRKILGDTLR